MTKSCQVVLIGYGNDLRSDDGAGQWVARAVADWNLPQLRAIAVHQLTPDLCALLVEAEHAFFVDASLLNEAPFVVEQLAPSAQSSPSGHSSQPGNLLALAEALYGHRPQAWLIQIAAHSYDFGLQLTPATRQACTQALEWLANQLIVSKIVE